MKLKAVWVLPPLLAVALIGAASGAAVGGTLTQQGPKLTANDESGNGQFGFGIALSADGNTGLIGGPTDHNLGAAWIFSRSGTTWTQQGAKLVPTDGGGNFGASVALSADGNTALVGGSSDSGSIGAAWVFTRSGSTWTQQGAKLVPDDEAGRSCFGGWVSLSADGNTALIGGGCDNGFDGAAWVFTRSGSTWAQQGPKLAPDDEAGTGGFGIGAMSADGTTAVIGAPADENGRGAVWVFARTGSTWSQAGPKVTPNDEVGPGNFGTAVAQSADGTKVLVSGAGDDSGAGASWVFTRSGSVLAQQGPKLVVNDHVPGAGSGVGTSVALDASGDEALITGNTDDNQVGAAWIFTRSGSTWAQAGSKLTANDESGAAFFGTGAALSGDGNTALTGGFGDSGFVGAAWPFAVALPTSKEQCKNGGWQTFGVFKNQGDCVSFAATHGANTPG